MRKLLSELGTLKRKRSTGRGKEVLVNIYIKDIESSVQTYEC